MFVDESTSAHPVIAIVGASTLSANMQTLGDVSIFQCGDKLGAYEEEVLRSAIQSEPTRAIVLDCAQLRGIDPTGLGVLVSVARFATAHGARLKLMNVRPPLASLLNENNLFTVFEMCSPREVITLWCQAVRHRPSPRQDCRVESSNC